MEELVMIGIGEAEMVEEISIRTEAEIVDVRERFLRKAQRWWKSFLQGQRQRWWTGWEKV